MTYTELVYIDGSTLFTDNSDRKRFLLQSAVRAHAARYFHRIRKDYEEQHEHYGVSQSRRKRRKTRQAENGSGIGSEPGREPRANATKHLYLTSHPSESTDASKTLAWDDISGNNPSDAVICRQLAPSINRDHHGLRVDAFVDIPPTEATFAWRLIDYVVQVMIPAQTMLDNVFSVQGTYRTYDMQSLVEGDARYATMLAFYSYLHQLVPHGPNLPVEVLRYVQQAVSLHRKRLRTPDGKSDELNIRVTLQLALLAEATEDQDSFLVHKKAISNMLASVGGLSGLPVLNPIRKLLLQWNLFWALSDESATMFDHPSPTYTPYYPRYPFSPRFHSLVARLPAGFQDLAKQGYLASDVLELLDRVLDTTIGLKCLQHSSNNTTEPEPGVYASFWEALPCLHRANDADGTPDLERMIVLGLILYFCRIICSTPAPLVASRAARKRLSVDIIQAVHHKARWPDMILWLWMNAIDSWEDPNHSLHTQGLKLVQSMKQSFPSVTSDYILRRRLKRFFWHEGFVERCARYWHFDSA